MFNPIRETQIYMLEDAKMDSSFLQLEDKTPRQNILNDQRFFTFSDINDSIKETIKSVINIALQ